MNSKILVIGESCTDVFYRGEVNRLCPEAPVPVFKVTGITENGGMAMNVKENLKSLGNNVSIITNENWTKITKSRYVHTHSNHMFLRVDESDEKYGLLDVKTLNSFGDLEQYDAIVVSDYHKGFLTEQMLEKISKMHNLVFLDTKKILGSWSENFSFIKINNKEYNLTKHKINNAIKEKLIVTHGPLGCIYKNKTFGVPKVEIKDTSGAGDTFLSGLASMYCYSGDIEKSIIFANECATKVVQKKGVSII